MTHICSKCNEAKPTSKFGYRADRPGKLRTICYSCRNQQNRDRWRNTSEGQRLTRASNKRAYEKRSREHKRKHGTCEICLQEKPLCFDHNHQTGAFRGWLCNNCNSGLGFFKDDLKTVQAAAIYLATKEG